MRIHELGHVVLYVTSLKASVHFYRDILGFPLIGEMIGAAAFSAGRTHHEMLLIEIGPSRSPRLSFIEASRSSDEVDGKPREKSGPEPGLYHIGFKIGSTPEE